MSFAEQPNPPPGTPRGTHPPGGPWGRVGKGIEIDLDIAGIGIGIVIGMGIGMSMSISKSIDLTTISSDRFNDDFNFEVPDDEELLSHADKSAD